MNDRGQHKQGYNFLSLQFINWFLAATDGSLLSGHFSVLQWFCNLCIVSTFCGASDLHTYMLLFAKLPACMFIKSSSPKSFKFRQVLIPPGSAALAGDVLCRMMLDHCPRWDLNKAHFSIVEFKCRWESGWVPGESGSDGVLLSSSYPAQGLSESIVLFHHIERW